VVTLHDATFFSDPDRHGRLKRLFFSYWTRRALRDARTECVVPSAATAAELRHHVPGVRSRVRVALHGVDLTTFRVPRESEAADLRESIGLPPGARWITFLGTIEPRKNLAILLQAHQDLRRVDPSTPDLLVAGGRGWDHAALSLLDGLTPTEGVHALGYVPVEALPALLGGSEIVAYPSSAEGFGLPVLEAMATGACVLTTRSTAIPEVGGDAVAYAEPTRHALGEALRSLLADAPRRESLGAAGRERAETFTWSRTATEHTAAYEAAQ
jgi:glycosyltransferase involved in cell wall biosynthesis